MLANTVSAEMRDFTSRRLFLRHTRLRAAGLRRLGLGGDDLCGGFRRIAEDVGTEVGASYSAVGGALNGDGESGRHWAQPSNPLMHGTSRDPEDSAQFGLASNNFDSAIDMGGVHTATIAMLFIHVNSVALIASGASE